jgi:hypothetical protein
VEQQVNSLTGEAKDMAEWQERTPVYVGDAFGNPRQVLVGVVTINDRTTVGVQFPGEHDHDRPDITMDARSTAELMSVLRSKLKELTQVNPMGGS